MFVQSQKDSEDQNFLRHWKTNLRRFLFLPKLEFVLLEFLFFVFEIVDQVQLTSSTDEIRLTFFPFKNNFDRIFDRRVFT